MRDARTRTVDVARQHLFASARLADDEYRGIVRRDALHVFFELLYRAAAAYRAENCPAEAHVRIGWFRAVANIYQVFAASSFVDELAHAAGRDPLEYQLDLLGPGAVLDFSADGVKDYWNYGVPAAKYPFDTRRLRKVLEVAAEKSGWSKRPRTKGRGMGIVAARSFASYIASVVEVVASVTLWVTPQALSNTPNAATPNDLETVRDMLCLPVLAVFLQALIAAQIDRDGGAFAGLPGITAQAQDRGHAQQHLRSSQ